MENITEKALDYVHWLKQLKIVTSDATNTPIHEIKINEDAAFEYYKDGYTPTQCFREEWANDGN